MNTKKLLFVILISITVLFAQENDTEKYNYRPYPVLFVHGYLVGNWSWGIVTDKGEDDDNLMQTWIENYSSPSVAMNFRNLFDNITGFEIPYDTTEGEFPRCDRFVPWEESDKNPENTDFEGSYNAQNHTYVETYCTYKYNESVDQDGCFAETGQPENYYKFIGRKGCEGDPVGYDLSQGGMTQLLRIRIIQLLNEYYGDFKWVNDPSAKIKIIAKSKCLI